MATKRPMTLQKAIAMLEKEYERAQKLDFEYNPLAWALFRVWKAADEGSTEHD